MLLSPIISLLVAGLLPPTAKAALVFWRTKEILPGHRAFSKHAKNDPRISVDEIKKLVNEWPRNGMKQNELWYRLYRQVDETVTVRSAHRSYLLARDLCCISLVFLALGLVIHLVQQASIVFVASYVGVLGLHYLMFAIVARNHGNRFVRNVLVEFQNKPTPLAA